MTSNQSPVTPAQNDRRTWHGHIADDTGATYGPEPMATLTATKESLQVASTRGTFTLAREAVKKIGRGNMYPWLFSSIRIHHRCAGVPCELQFKPMGLKPAELLRQLREAEFPVA